MTEDKNSRPFPGRRGENFLNRASKKEKNSGRSPATTGKTAPNITSGLVLELEEDQTIETDETAEKALKQILSAGFGAENREAGRNR